MFFQSLNSLFLCVFCVFASLRLFFFYLSTVSSFVPLFILEIWVRTAPSEMLSVLAMAAFVSSLSLSARIARFLSVIPSCFEATAFLNFGDMSR